MKLDVARLAEFAVSTYNNKSVPVAAREKAMIRFVDGLACLYAGCKQPHGELAKKFLQKRRGSGSTAIPGAIAVAPEYAAWCHGLLIHAIDWDDWTFTLMHPTAITLPSVMAVAEYKQTETRVMLDAFVVAVETVLRLARAVNPELYMRGWHPSGTIGSIGAAVGAGLVLGHSAEQLRHGIALAVCQAAGTFGNRGTMGKPFQVGNSNRAGVMAALLVDDGFDGADDILDTKFGFGETVLAGLELRTPAWGSPDWEILREWPVKPFPVGGARQTLIEATIRARKQLGVTGPGDIAEVNCRVSEVIAHIDHDPPSSWLDSRFSHRYCAAVAAAAGRAGPDEFGAERFGRGDVQEVMSRVCIIADPTLESDASHGFPSVVEMVLTDGRRHSESCTSVVGEDVSMADSCAKLDEVIVAGRKASDVLAKLTGTGKVPELVKALAFP